MSSGIEACVPVRRRRAVCGWAKGRNGLSLPAARSAAGFSLIELMITVLIVGIIAAFAIPSYRNSVIKGNRRAAQAAMMDIAQREQQYLLDQRAYVAYDSSTDSCPPKNTNALNYAIPADVCEFYQITATPVANAVPPAFTITAAPLAGSMQASDGQLGLDNTGAKTPASLW